jgi:UDP:flavonoid glycosyltransferase YjiC (YdhE family)
MPLTGHLNPMTTLARKLQSRGHEIVFIGVPDTAQSAALDWISSPVAKRSSPQGHAPAFSLPLPGSTAWKHGRMSEIQVVLAKGNNIERTDLGPIPSNVIVVDQAPQIELLKRATLCITHAGLNTALESLAYGVPMVAIPIGYDQFGVAARIAYHGVGESLGVGGLSVDGLHALVQRVLSTHSYREKAQYFKTIIAQRRGLDVAAETIERAFTAALANRAPELSYS